MDTKICTKCQGEFPATREYFNITKQIKSGLKSRCRNCHNEFVKKWKKGHPDKIAKYQKNYQENSTKLYGAANRKYHLKKSYGVSVEDFMIAEVWQDYRCSICKKHRGETKKGLYLDHCHITKKNRGLLCSQCNSMLGFANDDPEVLKRAIQYLKNPPGIFTGKKE